MKYESQTELAEEKHSLWLMVISPSIWMAHFLVSYAAGSVWCGGFTFAIIIGLAIAALVGIVVTGLAGWQMHRRDGEEEPHDAPTQADRHRFLGFATVLLSALSAIATVYVAIAVLYAGSCLHA